MVSLHAACHIRFIGGLQTLSKFAAHTEFLVGMSAETGSDDRRVREANPDRETMNERIQGVLPALP